MTMAMMKMGKPVYVPNNTVAGYNAGDVLIYSGYPVVANIQNPYGLNVPVTPDAVAIFGGIYLMASDAAYTNGTPVYWNTVTQQVTATYKAGVTYPFGAIVTGPSFTIDDGGPTGAASNCWVFHAPFFFSANAIPSSQPLANFRNMIDGGDFTTNPWQRGTVQAADITNTLTYTADRFFVVAGASSAIDWSQVADATLAGFNQCLKIQRKSGNADLTAIKFGQVLESADCIKTQGQQVTLSFWAKAGANYSGGPLTVALNHSITAGDDTAAHLVAASTNWLAVPTVINTTQALTSIWTRYQFVGTVPAAATQLGMLLTWTPTGTASTDDSISFQGFQLEIAPGASPFEHRDKEVEIALCQRYYTRITETNGGTFALGAPTGSNTQTYPLWLPTPMRISPTVNVTAGGFKVNTDGGGNAAPTGLAAGAAHSPTLITLVTTLTQTAAAHSNALVGTGTTGYIEASAEF